MLTALAESVSSRLPDADPWLLHTHAFARTFTQYYTKS